VVRTSSNGTTIPTCEAASDGNVDYQSSKALLLQLNAVLEENVN
jgi:hypothetical protein